MGSQTSCQWASCLFFHSCGRGRKRLQQVDVAPSASAQTSQLSPQHVKSLTVLLFVWISNKVHKMLKAAMVLLHYKFISAKENL